MLFHSFEFLIFFSIVFTVYWLIQSHRWRLNWLLAASCYFYMSWNPLLILLILFSASVDYVVAIRLEGISSPRIRRIMLIFSICVNLGLLLFFKYTNFLLDTVTPVFQVLGLGSRPPLIHLILPLGISFYTFETISYIVDVYRGGQKAVRNPIDYALYIMFFPHLVAGPIVRTHEFLPQLATIKCWSWFRLQLGIQLFVVGLFKKVVIADSLAPLVDMVFARPDDFNSFSVWMGVVCCSVQVYCDFSGYSDMAIGLAHMLGFTLPTNFRLPFLATNIAEFWARWHITLSTWLRDYLYVPLGGNRHGTLATYRNVMLTMLLGGLWHGASWNFAVWGLYHGTLLVIYRISLRPGWRPAWLARPWAVPLCVAVTFLCVTVGRVFFRAQRFKDTRVILSSMFFPTPGESLTGASISLAAALLFFVFACHMIAQFSEPARIARRLPAPVLGTLLGMMVLTIQLAIPEGIKSFVYFQF